MKILCKTCFLNIYNNEQYEERMLVKYSALEGKGERAGNENICKQKFF